MSIIIQNEMKKRSIEKKRSTSLANIARFQSRWFVLQKDQLIYHSKSGKNRKGSISVLSVRVCEDIEYDAFQRHHVFQIGFLEKGKLFHLYIAAGDRKMREKWKEEIRGLCSCYVAMVMYKTYHKGVFKKKSWTCCAKDGPDESGCSTAFSYPEKLARAKLLGDIGSPKVTKTPTYNEERHMQRRGRIHMPSECEVSYSDVVDESSDGLGGMAWSSVESIEDADQDESYVQTVSSAKKGCKTTSLQRPRTLARYMITGADPWESVERRFKKFSTMPYVTSQISSTSAHSSPSLLGMGGRVTRYTSDSDAYELERTDSAASSSSKTSSMFTNRPSITTLSRRLNSQGSTVYSDASSIPRTESDYQSSLQPEDEEKYDETFPPPIIPISPVAKVARHFLGKKYSHEQTGRCESGSYVNINIKDKT